MWIGCENIEIYSSCRLTGTFPSLPSTLSALISALETLKFFMTHQ